MATFECTWCGKCCACYGDFIKIERKLTSRDYYCRYGIKDELFLAHIEGDYAGTHRPGPEEGGPEKGCPFMRKNPAGSGFACAIYATRPQICREFRCYRMLIHHPDGHECGRIMGRNELKTVDGTLEQIWKEQVAHLTYNDDMIWIKNVITLLTAHGYRGELVE